MSDDTLVNSEGTGTTAETTSQEKTYTQKEFDDHMARMKESLKKKFLKPYEDLGDPDELRQLRQTAEQAKQEAAMKRGDFEKILQESLSKKDAEIQKRDQVIQAYRIDTPLIEAASKFRAVNADQVKALLKNNVRLNADGEVEVVDIKGTVRYDDNGQLLSVDDYVKEFLDSNPHFQSATVATSSTKTNLTVLSSGKVDINALDMKNPEHRKKYKEAKAKGLV